MGFITPIAPPGIEPPEPWPEGEVVVPSDEFESWILWSEPCETREEFCDRTDPVSDDVVVVE